MESLFCFQRCNWYCGKKNKHKTKQKKQPCKKQDMPPGDLKSRRFKTHTQPIQLICEQKNFQINTNFFRTEDILQRNWREKGEVSVG